MTRSCARKVCIDEDGTIARSDARRRGRSRPHEKIEYYKYHRDARDEFEAAARQQAINLFSEVTSVWQGLIGAMQTVGEVTKAKDNLTRAPGKFFNTQLNRETAMGQYCKAYSQNKSLFESIKGMLSRDALDDSEVQSIEGETGDTINGEIVTARTQEKMTRDIQAAFKSGLSTYDRIFGIENADMLDDLPTDASPSLVDLILSAADPTAGLKGDVDFNKQFDAGGTTYMTSAMRQMDAVYDKYCDGENIKPEYQFREKVHTSFQKAAAEIDTTANARLSAYAQDMEQATQMYGHAFTYRKKLIDLYEVRKHEKEQLLAALERQRADTLTNNRKAVYEIDARGDLTGINTALKWTWIALILVYVVLGPFIPDEQWKLWYTWVLIVVLASLPWVMHTIGGALHRFWHTVVWWRENRAPKNVYTQL